MKIKQRMSKTRAGKEAMTFRQIVEVIKRRKKRRTNFLDDDEARCLTADETLDGFLDCREAVEYAGVVLRARCEGGTCNPEAEVCYYTAYGYPVGLEAVRKAAALKAMAEISDTD